MSRIDRIHNRHGGTNRIAAKERKDRKENTSATTRIPFIRGHLCPFAVVFCCHRCRWPLRVVVMLGWPICTDFRLRAVKFAPAICRYHPSTLSLLFLRSLCSFAAIFQGTNRGNFTVKLLPAIRHLRLSPDQ